MKLLRSIKDGQNVPKSKSVEVVLVHCNLVKSFCFCSKKKIWAVNKYFTTFFKMTNTVKTEFSSVEVWFIEQASKAIEIEDNVKLTLIIG